ncbi:MAG: amidophosphoribosyltransferase, partial [Solirubrobacteraceae bacterium]|nr:amidophosphoribosyltransferase [Solirubrobacteraceae bacterium]
MWQHGSLGSLHNQRPRRPGKLIAAREHAGWLGILDVVTTLDEREGPRDECGVFGIYAPGHDVSRLAYFALYALQHRGQESAGIAAADVHGHIMTLRELGLVNQVFDEQKLRALGGDIAVGHVRYSTTGSNGWDNAQPVHRSDRRELALGHNGNLINAVEL